MTTLNVQLTNICSGGNHLTFGVSVNGGAVQSINTDAETILSEITDEEKEVFVKVFAKLYKLGRTMNQAKIGLQTGVGVTL